MQKEKFNLTAKLVAAMERCSDLEERCQVLVAKKKRMEHRKQTLEEEVQRSEALKRETEAKAASEEQWTTDQRPSLEAAVERLTRHRDAWQELCRDLRRTVVQHEHELKELREESEKKLVERHRLQSECLQLQEECDAQSLLDVRQRVEEGSQHHARMQSILQPLHSAHDLAEKTRTATEVHHGSKEHLFDHKKQLQKNQVAQIHADLFNLEDQCDAFENTLSCAIAETESLEHKVAEAKRGKVIENQKEAFARQRLEAARGRQKALQRRGLELQRLCKNIEDESVQLQDERARLLLGARRKAVASVRSRSHEPSPVVREPLTASQVVRLKLVRLPPKLLVMKLLPTFGFDAIARVYPITNTDVQFAWLYTLGVTPTRQPGFLQKLLGGFAFWIICYTWHHTQRRLWLRWDMPGEPGQVVSFQRVRSGDVQVALTSLAVLLPSIFCFFCYAFSATLLRHVVNPVFTPKTRLKHILVTALMFAMAFSCNVLMTTNWVVWSVGVFTYASWAFCGRTVPTEMTRLPLTGTLTKLSAKKSERELGVLTRRAEFKAASIWMGDESILVERYGDQWVYTGYCGRANIFRPDVALVLCTALVWRIPWFILGTGNYNQCVGWAELCMIFYIPFGYPALATFGFRLALANGSMICAMVLIVAWPLVNLFLGGKGCSTLTDLVLGEYLPEIWTSTARNITFNRGYEACAVQAYQEGGEALLVASTTVAAWVHIMSNYSFLFGFGLGLYSKTCDPVEEVRVDLTIDQARSEIN